MTSFGSCAAIAAFGRRAATGNNRLIVATFTRQIAVKAKLKAGDDARRETLIGEATAWQAAQNIRAYSAHVRSASSGIATTEMAKWHEWANSAANHMDPTLQRIATVHPRLI
jgi:hypothetical protein